MLHWNLVIQHAKSKDLPVLLVYKGTGFYVKNYQPSIHANISGTTMVASLSTINLGV